MSLPTDKLLWVTAGGGLGSAARYLVALGTIRWFGPAFPWGTFAVNVLGSFLFGLLLMQPYGSENLRLGLGTGVLGGFTTYSAFNYETLRMIEGGSYTRAALYAGTTFVLCLIAGAGGVLLGRV